LQAEANKVKDLQKQLEELPASHELDKTTSLNTLEAQLEQKRKEETVTLLADHEAQVADLRAKHETEVFTLNSTHSKEIQKLEARTLPDEIRRIRKDFHDHQAAEIQQAANEAAAHARSLMLDEIRSLEASHTHQISHLRNNHQQELANLRSFLEAEREKAAHEAVVRAKSEHAAETAAFMTRQREELTKKADGELRTLSDAHSSKTASLESQVVEANAAKQTAEEKARRAAELEHQVETKSNELDTVKVELEQTKRKLKNMADELAKYNLLGPLLIID
jgi:hypothetical protein